MPTAIIKDFKALAHTSASCVIVDALNSDYNFKLLRNKIKGISKICTKYHSARLDTTQPLNSGVIHNLLYGDLGMSFIIL